MSSPRSVVTPPTPNSRASAERSESLAVRARAPGALGSSVYQSTFTPPSDDIHIDRDAGRLRAMRSGVLTSARVIDEQLELEPRKYRRAAVTLTYARPGEWESEHVTRLINCYRAWAGRRGFLLPYVWVAEIQQQRYERTGDAVVHYHLVLWLPFGFTPPMPDKQGWWPHGMTQVAWVRSPVGYLDYQVKYLTKGGLMHLFPRGARIWGAGGLCAAFRLKRSFLRLPAYLTALFAQPGEVYRVLRARGGGWEVPARGLWIRSPWRLDRFSSRLLFAVWVGWGPGDIVWRDALC